MDLNNYDKVRSLLVVVAPTAGIGEQRDWRSLWLAVAAHFTQLLASTDLASFEAGFGVVAEALNVCEAGGRQTAMPLLFGDFTRRAIGAGVDRTRFVRWLGPPEILNANPGRVRGRVLYFSNAKGRGKILGADGVVYFCHYSQIQGVGFRSIDGGELVEFTPQFGSFNGVEGFGAYSVACVSERDPVKDALAG